MSIIALNDSTRAAPKGKLPNEQVSGLYFHVNPSMQTIFHCLKSTLTSLSLAKEAIRYLPSEPDHI